MKSVDFYTATTANRLPPKDGYKYEDAPRADIYKMVPPDGKIIGTIGCGRAHTEAALVREGRTVHGVDISPEAIISASERLTTARVITTDVRLPFPIDSLDGLILADVIEHLPHAWEALADYSSMVKPGGWVIISVPNMRSLDVLWQLVARGDWPEYPVGIFDDTHIQVMTHKRLQRWCTASGLEVEKWYDNYDYRFIRRNIYKTLNFATFKIFRSFFTYQVQARFRRVASTAK